MSQIYDSVIVGGSFAGLAAAVSLSRSRRKVLVIDAGEPRNARAQHAHNLLGQEGVNPSELLQAARKEARAYGAELRSARAHTARKLDNGFLITAQDSQTGDDFTAHGRTVLLATGLVDELPQFPGLEEGWGESVLHCPYCHGWEVRGQRLGIIATDLRFAHQALLFGQLSHDVTILRSTAYELPEQESRLVAASGIKISPSPLLQLRMDGSQVVGATMADGSTLALDAVVVAPIFTARTELFEQLGGVPLTNAIGRTIPYDAMGQTPVPGVFAAGNSSNAGAMVYAATASGTQSGAGINYVLATADAQAALARQTPKPGTGVVP